MDRIELCAARLGLEEGRRLFAYNDATGKQVTCKPTGNLSIGVGVNLEYGLDNDEVDWLLSHRLTKMDTSLRAYAWYPPLDEIRGSVFLDLAFNNGVTGLLHYPKMILAASQGNWDEASAELLDSNAARELPHRYEPLAKILKTGALS